MGSLVVNADGDYIQRSANLPALTGATMAGWVNLDSVTPGATKYICGLAAGTAERMLLQFHTDNSLNIITSAYTIEGMSANPTGRAGQWLYVAITSDASNLKGYWWYNNSGTLVLGGSASATGWSSPGATTDMIVGARGNWRDAPALGKYAYWKTWDAALSQAQIEADAYSPTYVYTTSANTGFADSATDIGPNGRNWTHSSITTDSDTPPIVFGSNNIVLTWNL